MLGLKACSTTSGLGPGILKLGGHHKFYLPAKHVAHICLSTPETEFEARLGCVLECSIRNKTYAFYTDYKCIESSWELVYMTIEQNYSVYLIWKVPSANGILNLAPLSDSFHFTPILLLASISYIFLELEGGLQNNQIWRPYVLMMVTHDKKYFT